MADIVDLQAFKANSQSPQRSNEYERFCAARQAMLRSYIDWLQSPGVNAEVIEEEAASTLKAIGAIPVYLQKTERDVIDA